MVYTKVIVKSINNIYKLKKQEIYYFCRKNIIMVTSKTTVEIINIGDEILIGQIVNTNASWMANTMNNSGFSVTKVTVIADEKDAILQNLHNALNRADIILLTGGLGPTNDDITKHALAEYFNSELKIDKEALQNVTELFASRKIELTEINRLQAELPVVCSAIKNSNGTAPGMWFEKEGKIVVSMPGVPMEMKGIMTDYVIPKLKIFFVTEEIVHKTIMTHGIGESHLAEAIKEWEDALPENIKLAYLPRPGIVRLRLSSKGNDRKSIIHEINNKIQELIFTIPEYIFGYDDITLEEAVGCLLKKNSATISTAESCTGGTIAQKLTRIPGSSEYFKGSVVAYANEIKENLLKVSGDDLEKQGAVSQQVVEQMATGVRELFNTDYAISTSGIAGPDGGTPDKPVGTIWIAVASKNEVKSKLFHLGNNRERNIERSALSGLNMVRQFLTD